MGYSLPADPALRGDVKLLTGTAPSGAHQVAIDATSAEEHHIALGSTIKVLFNGPTQEFTVVGTVGFGGEKNLGGTTGAYFDSATAQKVLGAPGLFDSINVSADPGVAPADLVQRITTVLPDGAEAVTGATVVKESADAVNKDLKVVTVLFMIFAGIALFVGSFIIWNTFTMTITQRSREIALLRAIGATRRQVNRSLVLEALLLGLVASAVGIGLGLLVAKGLNLLMDAVGFSLPSTSMQVEPRTIVVSLLVGTVVTVVAALVPAYRATKVLPVEALREAVPGSGNPTKKRVISGAVVTVIGLTGLFMTLYADLSMKLFGPSLLAIIVGVLMLLPAAARPLASLIGVPLRLRGLPGELARQNAMRNPRRTSSTAAALMVGLTLVVSMGVFASSLKASFGDIIGDSTNAALFVTPSSTQGPGYSPEAIKVVQGVSGVDKVSASGWGQARFDGADSSYSSVDPATATAGLNLRLSAGSVSEPRHHRDRGGAVRRDDARVEGRRHHRDRVRRDRQAHHEGRRHLRQQGLDQRRLRHQHRRSDRRCRSAADHAPAWSRSCPAPTGRPSRRPSPRPWPTTPTRRCSIARGSRRRPAASSTSCSPSSR